MHYIFIFHILHFLTLYIRACFYISPIRVQQHPHLEGFREAFTNLSSVSSHIATIQQGRATVSVLHYTRYRRIYIEKELYHYGEKREWCLWQVSVTSHLNFFYLLRMAKCKLIEISTCLPYFLTFDKRTFLCISGIFVLFFASGTLGQYEGIAEPNSLSDSNNCSTTDSFVIFRTPSETQRDEREVAADVPIDGPRNDTNISHLKTPTDWNNWTPKLKFPTTSSEKQYKMANLQLDRGMFVFDFLRKFLSLIQPYDVPVGKVCNIKIFVTCFVTCLSYIIYIITCFTSFLRFIDRRDRKPNGYVKIDLRGKARYFPMFVTSC